MKRHFLTFLGITSLVISLALTAGLVFGLTKQEAQRNQAQAISQSKSQRETMVVASWNLENFSAKKLADDAVKARFARYLQSINADILLLQEINQPQALAEALTSLQAIDYRVYFEDRKGIQLQAFAISPKVELLATPTTYDELNPSGNLRSGLEMHVKLGGQILSLLGVHLKSMCHDRPLSSNNKDCQALKDQLPALQVWIKAQIQAGQPFLILGDFNRRFDRERAELNGDYLWPLLFNPDAKGFQASLVRPGRFQASACHDGKFPYFIDHMVMNEAAAAMVRLASFGEILFAADEDKRSDNSLPKMNPRLADPRLSDHCAIKIILQAPANK